MCITDPISDMFTSIRNANMILRESVDVSSSKIKKAILKVLKDEGYIKDYKEVSVDSNKSTIRIYLKYGPLKQRVLNNIERVSKCSRRIYKQGRKVTKVMGGFGTAIYSTSKGIISDKECRALKIGS